MIETIKLGNENIFDHVKSRIPITDIKYWGSYLFYASRTENIEFLRYIYSFVPKNIYIDWTRVVSCVTYSKIIFDIIMQIIPQGTILDWNKITEEHISCSLENLFDHIRSKAPTDYKWNWTDLATNASYRKDKSLFNSIISLAPPDEINLNKVFRIAINR